MKSENELRTQIEEQKRVLLRETAKAQDAILELLSVRRWIERYPLEAAMVFVTGAAIISEALLGSRRTQRLTPEATLWEENQNEIPSSPLAPERHPSPRALPSRADRAV